MEVFGDRSFRFTSVPEQLKGAEWIRTACDSKKYGGVEASFKAGADITAFIGVDTRAEANVSSWLSGWTKTDFTLVDNGNPIVTYNVYKKDVKKDEEVRLGAVDMSSAVNYVVMAKPYDPDEDAHSAHAYPLVTGIDYDSKHHQFRVSWDPVDGAQNYGMAVYIAGRWKVQTQTIPANTTTYTSPKLKAGQSYKIVIAAKINGKWDISALNRRSVTVTIK